MDQVDRFLARGCDVLFVNLVDRTAAAVIADKAEAARGEEGTLTALPFFILRREDIYAPENQKLLFPIMSSSSR